MSNVQLSDPDKLTDEEIVLLGMIERMSPDDLDAFMRRYVAAPTDSLQFVVRHPDVVELTYDSLNRLFAQAQQRLQHSQGRSQRQLAQDQIGKLGRERRAIRPHLNLALAELAKDSPRRRAEAILGEARYPELKKIIADVEAGMSTPQALSRAKERVKEATMAQMNKKKKDES